MTTILVLLAFLSCAKDTPVSIKGEWISGETIYNFDSELLITQDGESESYCYYISNDTLYLDYGLPFLIESLTKSDLVLSKNDGINLYVYQFKRIDG